MNDAENKSQYLTKLRRLWKGTLYVGIVAVYVGILVASLVVVGWKTALLVLGLIGLSQLFRYIASEVDRIGWVIRGQDESDTDVDSTTSLKRRLFGLLTLLVQLPVVALVIHVYMSVGEVWSAALLLALIVVELLFQEIRRINRKVAYREASYGFQDRSLLEASHQHSSLDQGSDEVLTERLERLEKLAAEGKISKRGFEKARDKYWIRHVMDSRE